MTEAQATELIEAVERLEVLLGVVNYFVQVIAYAAPATAGLVLALIFIRALIVKGAVT